MSNQFLTIRQTAKMGVLSEHHLRLMEKQGRLPGIYAGNRFLVNYPVLLEQLDLESRSNTRSSNEIGTLQDRDKELEELWAQFGDIPMNPETECMEERFLEFPAGTHREEVWKWFDQRYSKGVAYLLYGGAEDYVPETKRLYAMSKLCFVCDADTCLFNHNGECRYAMVHEEKPKFTEENRHFKLSKDILSL